MMRLPMPPRAALTLLLLISTHAAVAQVDVTADTPPDSVPAGLPSVDELRARIAEQDRDAERIPFPAGTPPAAGLELDSTTLAHQREALRAYYDYRTQGYDHRMRVFEWQLFSSRIIFVVVILLVLAGVYFSGVQFHTGLRAKRDPTVSEVEATVRGVKVTSSTLGVVILVISLVFFYLYLAFVYPITETF